MRSWNLTRPVLAAILVSLGATACASNQDDTAKGSTEPVSSVEQELGYCNMQTLGLPCAPPGPGTSECGGVCWLNLQGNAACIATSNPNLPAELKNLDGAACQGGGFNQCSHHCQNGACVNGQAADGAACTIGFSGNACSGVCQAGNCQANPAPCAYGRKVPGAANCVFQGCMPISASTCKDWNLLATTACSDADACTGTPNEQCNANGVCVPGPAKNCSDNNDCTTDTCTTATGVCNHAPVQNGTTCNDGNGCTQTDTCLSGACVGSNLVVCTASDQCHNVGVCQPATGTCTNPPKANGTSCNDTNACTQTDTCQAGTCTGANPITCTASDACHVAGTCDPQSGICSNPPANNGTACNDGNACTTQDSCQAGVCTGTPMVCVSSNPCHDAACVAGNCLETSKADGTSCVDSDLCTQTDVCVGGTCTGGNPVVCGASDQCHAAGVCNPGTGTCSNPPLPDGTACNDGSVCTTPDTCVGGVCTGTSTVVCTALDQCHDVGTCDPGNGTCSNPAKADGSACNDNDVCTVDTCQAGACVGVPKVCTPSNECHTSACNTSNGNCDETVLPDGTVCGVTGTCQGGVCVGGEAGVPDAGDDGAAGSAGSDAGDDGAAGTGGSSGAAGTAGAAGVAGSGGTGTGGAAGKGGAAGSGGKAGAGGSAGKGGAAGSGGKAGNAGAAGKAGDAGVPDSGTGGSKLDGSTDGSTGGAPSEVGSGDDGGCGCAVPGSSGMPATGWLVIGGAILAALRRRRRS
ncbi:MAG: hypothetical protein HY898_13080 [Deltaproteobacteria bacterium]|nr:hypothetical protein [Deltaproteobacteria bacterium]